MIYTQLTIRHHRRKPGYISVHYQGTTDEPGLGKCSTAGLLCEIHRLEGGFVVMDPIARKPIRIEPTPDSLATWLGEHGAPMETVTV